MKNVTISHLNALALIFILTLSAYFNSFHGAFQFDDMYYIVNNNALRDITNLSAIWQATSVPIRFVTFWTFALNYHWHGYDVFGYHLFNFIIHVMNAFLVYALGTLLFQTPRLRHSSLRRGSFFIALTAALIFALHPLLTQAVSYVSQRFASLATLFYLSALCCYLRARLVSGGERNIFLILCVFASLVGMLTKQITITIPVMILMCEWFLFVWYRKHNFRYALYFLPLILVIPFFYKFQPTFITTANVESGNFVGDRMTWQTYSMTQTRVILTYLRLFFVPLGQRLDYSFAASNSLLGWKTMSCLIFILSTGLSALICRRRYPLVAFGVFWFYIALSVESSFIVIKHVIFEHRMYLPSVGLSFLVAGALYILFTKRNYRLSASVCILGVLLFLTVQRNMVWQSSLSLWEDNLKKEPGKARPYISLGIASIQDKKYDEALAYFNQAIMLDPSKLKAFHNRGLAYQEKGRYTEALADYTQALSLEGHKGVIYSNRGSLYSLLGRKKEALADYNQSIQVNAAYPQVYVNRGVLLGERGMYEEALADFNRALALNPKLPEALNNRGIVYQYRKEYTQALADFDLALKVQPHYPEALYNRGNVYKDQRNYDKALMDYAEALQINPEYAEVYNNRGIVFGILESPDKALTNFTKALELRPRFAEAYYNRSLAHLRLKQYDQALKDTLLAQKMGKALKPEYIQKIQWIAGNVPSGP